MAKYYFTGIPEKSEVTPIPNIIFSELMPDINDIIELKIVLHIFWLLSRSKRFPKYITLTELKADSIIIRSIEKTCDRSSIEAVLYRGLDLAVKHGILLDLCIDRNDIDEYAYFINTDKERRTIEKIKGGDLVLQDLTLGSKVNVSNTISDVYTLYEHNIGVITPIIAEELHEAEGLYPFEWIEDAFREAITRNKRNWKYIARILEIWLAEGKDDGKYRGDFKTKRDPDKYIKGKYGHMVRR